jgi:hypothetical protein
MNKVTFRRPLGMGTFYMEEQLYQSKYLDGKLTHAQPMLSPGSPEINKTSTFMFKQVDFSASQKPDISYSKLEHQGIGTLFQT